MIFEQKVVLRFTPLARKYDILAKVKLLFTLLARKYDI